MRTLLAVGMRMRNSLHRSFTKESRPRRWRSVAASTSPLHRWSIALLLTVGGCAGVPYAVGAPQLAGAQTPDHRVAAQQLVRLLNKHEPEVKSCFDGLAQRRAVLPRMEVTLDVELRGNELYLERVSPRGHSTVVDADLEACLADALFAWRSDATANLRLSVPLVVTATADPARLVARASTDSKSSYAPPEDHGE